MGFYISALRANPSSCSWVAAVPQVSLLSATLLAFPYVVIVFSLFLQEPATCHQFCFSLETRESSRVVPL